MRRWLVPSLLLVLLALALLWPRRSAGLQTLLRWEPGREYRYRFTYASSDRVGFLGIAEAKMTGDFDVAGDLVIRAYGADGGVDQLGVRLEELTRHHYEAMGKPLLGSDDEARAALVGPEALVLMEPSGLVRGVEFPAKAPAFFRHTVTALFAQGAFELQAHQPRWDAVQAGPRGDAVASYEVARAGFRSWTVTKSLGRYTRLRAIPLAVADYEQKVKGPGTLELGRDGQLRSLQSEEQLEATSGGQTLLAVTAKVGFELSGVSPFDPGRGMLVAQALEAPVRLDQPVQTAEARAASLTRIAGGLEVDGLVDFLRLVPKGQPLPQDFFWRGAALLQLHPEACPQLAAMFGEPGQSSEVREAIAMLLVSAGSSEAQESLREVLGSDEARADPRFGAMITSSSFLEKPEPQTVALLEELDRTGQGTERVAATYALGAQLGSVYRGGERERALLADQKLLEALRTGQEPGRRRELLTALGNAGLAENVKDIGALSNSEEPSVRAAVANALRKTQTPEAESKLVGLTGDSNQHVQDAALVALQEYQLRPDLLTSLTAQVRAGGVDELSYTTLLNLVGRQQTRRDFPGEVRALLEAMRASPIERTEIRQAIEQALVP